MKTVKDIVGQEEIKKLPFHSALWEFTAFEGAMLRKGKIAHRRYHKQITRFDNGDDKKV